MTDKQDNLSKAMSEINRRYGDGATMRLSDKPTDVAVIPTGCLSLDLAIGVGGVPIGRTTEIIGLESSGKTTLMQHIVAEAQKMGGVAAYIDMEHSLDPAYAARCGVDTDALVISQPDTGEQAFEIAETLARSGGVRLIVIDSVAKLVTRNEVEGDMGDAEMGGRARLMGQGLRKMGPLLSKHSVALLFTNQIRNKIGVMYGSPETTPGGLSLGFEASVRIKLSRVNKETDSEHAHIKARVFKNKVAPPFKECEFDIYYDRGIDKLADLVNVAIAKGVIEGSGAWFKYGEHKWHGAPAVKAALQADAALADEILRRVKDWRMWNG